MSTLLELEPLVTFGGFFVGWLGAMVTGLLFAKARS